MKSTKIYRQLSACHKKWQHLASNVPSVVSASRSATSKTLSKHTITSQIRSFTSAGSRSAGIEVQGKESRGAVKTKDKSEKPERKVVFSAIQPTGIPHLGNYLGALSQWKRLQDEAIKDPNIKLYFSVVDLHALTVPGPKEALVASKKQTLAALLAIGLDPEHCALFYQSRIKQIANLYWILGCTSSMGYLSRMTQWKSKLKLDADTSLEDSRAKAALKHGLFSYPILQAADILIHRATHVPVGDDQRQHLEFARECVTNFNSTWKTNCLVAPETVIAPTKRIMSLTNPREKMSKSDPKARSRIHITDAPEEIEKKIKGAVTDALGNITYDPVERPGIANLLDILSAFDKQGRTPAQLAEEFADQQAPDLKAAVTKALIDGLAEIRDRYQFFQENEKALKDAEETGTIRAIRSAGNTMSMVEKAVGIYDFFH